MQIPRFILSLVKRRFSQKRWSACSWLRVNASTSLFSLFVMLRSEFFLHQALTLMTPSSLLFCRTLSKFYFSKHWSEDILSNLELIPPIYLLPNDGHSILQEWW